MMLAWLLILTAIVQGGYGASPTGYPYVPPKEVASDSVIHTSGARYAAADTFAHEFRIAYAKKGQPLFYYTDLLTPVCETGKCYLVSVEIFWDLVGVYLGYRLPDDKILTGKDHLPFSAADYEKLDRILGDPVWPLGRYAIEKLIVDSTKMLVDSDLDAYSGATAPFVQEKDNIPGALYTIHTLWNIVYEQEALDKMTSHTGAMMDLGRISLEAMLWDKRPSYWSWAVNQLKPVDINDSVRMALLNVVRNGDQYLAYDAMKFLDGGQDLVQRELWEIYEIVTVDKRRDIADKLMEKPLPDDLLVQMINYLLQCEDPFESFVLKQLIRKNMPLSEAVTDMFREEDIHFLQKL